MVSLSFLRDFHSLHIHQLDWRTLCWVKAESPEPFASFFPSLDPSPWSLIPGRPSATRRERPEPGQFRLAHSPGTDRADRVGRPSGVLDVRRMSVLTKRVS